MSNIIFIGSYFGMICCLLGVELLEAVSNFKENHSIKIAVYSIFSNSHICKNYFKYEALFILFGMACIFAFIISLMLMSYPS